MTSKTLIIIRGPSGSGKSTIADAIIGESLGQTAIPIPHHEGDHFFNYDTLKEYRFDPDKLHAAHTFCKLNVERDMFHGFPVVIVSNTSTTQKELHTYINLASDYGYGIKIYRTPGPWDAQALFERNRHGVPLETIEKQIARYAPHHHEVEWNDMSIF